MKTSLLALTLVTMVSPALACTAEEAQSKAMEVSTKMQELAASDPQKAMGIAKRLSDAQSQAATDLEGVCTSYDEMLSELDP